MSDDIQREYEKMSGEQYPGGVPTSDKSSTFARSLLVIITVFCIMGVGASVLHAIQLLGAGEVLVCSFDGSKRVISEPGYHFCPQSTSYKEGATKSFPPFAQATYWRVGPTKLKGQVRFRFQDALPGKLSYTIVYQLPPLSDKQIILMSNLYRDQANLESRLITPLIEEVIKGQMANASIDDHLSYRIKTTIRLGEFNGIPLEILSFHIYDVEPDRVTDKVI